MTQLFLIRHGQTEWNVQKRFQGSGDSPLTAEGMQQIRRVAGRMKKVKPTGIYTSPRKRAVETAKVIGAECGCEWHCINELGEISLGRWEGMKYEEIQQMDPAQYNHFFQNPSLFQMAEGGESYHSVQQRAVKATNQIIAEHPGETVILVSHAITIRLLLIHYMDRPLDDIWQIGPVHQTSVSEIRFAGKETSVVSLGSTAHLEETV